MGSWVNVKPSRAVWACWLVATLAICLARPLSGASELFDRYRALHDERAVDQFLNGLTPEEVLGLCNEIGADLDGKSMAAKGDAGMLLLIMLHKAQRSAVISPELLLRIAQDKAKSTVWRCLALHVSTGREGIVPLDKIEVEKVLPVYLRLAQDAAESDDLRTGAVRAAGEVLRNAYAALAARLHAQGPVHLPQGQYPIHRAEFDTAEWRRLDGLSGEFLGMCAAQLHSASASAALRVNGLARSVSETAWVRGPRTPGLVRAEEALRALLSAKEVDGWDEGLRRDLSRYAHSVRQLVGALGEHHE